VRDGPPFRADHVGSLIRPPDLVRARQAFAEGRLGEAELAGIEDRSVREIVAMQEGIGLKSVTDGEYRREYYLTSFFNSIGVALLQRQSRDLFYETADGTRVPGSRAEVDAKVGWTHSINVGAFAFLAATTRATPKVTIPAPTQIHFFAGSDGISRAAYADEETFWDDIVAAYHAELRALGAAGCRYVQLDETSMPKLADPAIQEIVARRGQDWRQVLATYGTVMGRIIAGKPAGMTLVVHHCRGNHGTGWQAQAGYDAVAEVMFGAVGAAGYFLEYDSPRAGDFSPLRFLPRDRIAVLGLVSTKEQRLEPVDELKRRIEAAARYVDIDRLCLSPQCGFSSNVWRPALTRDDQMRKLERIVETAAAVWGA
jgi:5-methyltetrahydropteroyltriglutamate--homocysteine methyltransferase